MYKKCTHNLNLTWIIIYVIGWLYVCHTVLSLFEYIQILLASGNYFSPSVTGEESSSRFNSWRVLILVLEKSYLQTRNFFFIFDVESSTEINNNKNIFFLADQFLPYFERHTVKTCIWAHFCGLNNINIGVTDAKIVWVDLRDYPKEFLSLLGMHKHKENLNNLGK